MKKITLAAIVMLVASVAGTAFAYRAPLGVGAAIAFPDRPTAACSELRREAVVLEETSAGVEARAEAKAQEELWRLAAMSAEGSPLSSGSAWSPRLRSSLVARYTYPFTGWVVGSARLHPYARPDTRSSGTRRPSDLGDGAIATQS